MGIQNPKGKVIKHFTVEVVDADSCPELKYNPSNPYANLSEEERMRDFIEIFAILWTISSWDRIRLRFSKHEGIFTNGDVICRADKTICSN